MSSARLGKQKADQLNAEHPGATLSSWLELNYKHVTLQKTYSDGKSKLVAPQSNVEMTIALLSTDNVADWAAVAAHWAPAGTILDKVPLPYYETKVLLLRQLLTKEVLTNPDNRLAQRYLTVLERRDADRWAQKQRAMKLSAITADQKSEDGDSSVKQLKLEIEVV